MPLFVKTEINCGAATAERSGRWLFRLLAAGRTWLPGDSRLLPSKIHRQESIGRSADMPPHPARPCGAGDSETAQEPQASSAEFDVWKGNTSMKSTLGTGFADWLGETRVFGEFLSFAIYGLLHRTLPNARSHGRGVLLILRVPFRRPESEPASRQIAADWLRGLLFRHLVQRGLPFSYNAAPGKGPT